MPEVLDYFRAKFPELNNVDDADLTAYVAQRKPEFLQDSEFRQLAAPMRGEQVMDSSVTKNPNMVDTRAGGPPVKFGEGSLLPESDYAETGHIIPRTPQEAMEAPSVWTQRGGKLLLGAMADLASTASGTPSTENLRSYANTPGELMPIEQGLNEMHGLSSVPTKAAAGLIRSVPALGVSAGAAMAKVPSSIAAALPMLTDQEGQIDPYGAMIAAGLPGVSSTAEKFVGEQLAKLPTAHLVAQQISMDPLQYKLKLVQKLGGIEISNDAFRKYLEAGGGAVAANAYLLASQTPAIMNLPPDQRKEAIIDNVAGNMATSLLAFSSRPGASETFKASYGKLQKLWEQTQNSRAVGGPPGPDEGQPPAAPGQIPPKSDGTTVPTPPTAPPPPAPVPPTVPARPPMVPPVQPPAPVPVPPAVPPVTPPAPAPVPAPATPPVQQPTPAPAPPVAPPPAVPPMLPPPKAPTPTEETEEPATPRLTLDEFRRQYTDAFNSMNKYSPDEVGRTVFAEKMAKLAEDYPEWAEQVENEKPPTTPPEPPAPAGEHPGRLLANHVRGLLGAGNELMPADVQKLGEEFGVTGKDAGEWAELGATLAARDIAQHPGLTPQEKFAGLVSLYRRMPTNGERTVDTKVMQQYSTPPPLSYVAQMLADFPHGQVFTDWTAGHGGLMTAANPQGHFMLNELDPNRKERLDMFREGFGAKSMTTQHDATSPSFHELMTKVAANRVGLNPPFGSVLDASGNAKKFPIQNAGTNQRETSIIDAAIMLNAFDAMTADGKGFAIIGAKTGTPWGGTFGTDEARALDYRKPVFLDLFHRFHVKDWFTIGGDLYRKMGAAWPVDVIIVHGKGKTPGAAEGGLTRPWIKPPRVIDTWEQLAELLPKAQHDNIKPGSPGEQTGGGAGGARPESPGSGAQKPGTPKVRPEGPEQPATNGGAGGGGGAQPPAIPNPTPQPPPSVNGHPGGGGSPRTPRPGGGVAPGGAPPQQPGSPPVGGERPVAPGSSPPQPGREQLIEQQIHERIARAKAMGMDMSEFDAALRAMAEGLPINRADLLKQIIEAMVEKSHNAQPPPAPRPDIKPSVPVEGLPAALAVPYQGASRGPSLNLVAPRNIANSMLAAQRALEQETGKSIDQYLAEKLMRTPAILHTQMAGAQIDAVALAIRNIERGGALITADQTGVGKGRMVAAIISYAKARGLVPVFVTAKKNLYEDMVARDLPALGDKDFVPYITDTQYTYENGQGKEIKSRGTSAARVAEMEHIVNTGQLPGGAHGVFTTYDQLKGDRPSGWTETPRAKFRRKNAKQERPDGPRWAMLRALAPRSIFILDEAHEAAGPASELNMKFTSVLPQAHGVYYSSATFAKRPDNMGIYALGTSIRRAGLNNEQLADALKAGGVPLQQALTSMLADSGELVRREQDWSGVPFNFKQTSSEAQADVEAADTYTAFIRDLMRLAKLVNGAASALEDGENQVRPEEQTVSIEPITFGSRLFNLSNQYLLALRSEAIVKEAVAELKAGRKPFIALYNTMEGPLLDLRALRLPLSFNGILRREMLKMLTITVKDPQEESGERKVELRPEDLPDGGAFYHQLEEQIMATDFSRLPISPIDHIKKGLQAAGYNVGELTARDGEVNDEEGQLTISKRERLERNRILKNYNDGMTDAIVVNGSGSTGLSAHTDPRFKDQRQRVMIVGQPAPDINQFMQMIGRVMRSGQTSKPRYTVLNTALAAERRFATMLRGKMTSLNANTTAEGESGMTQNEGFADDVFNKVGDEVVLRVMQANMDLARLMELELGNDDEGGAPEGFARKATGRFVLLPNADAQRLWDEIIAEFKDEIQQLDEQGQNPLRAAAEDLKAHTLEKSDLVQGTGNTPFDGPAVLEKCEIKPPKAPPSHAEAMQRASENRPVIQARVRAWIEKSRAAEEERVRVAQQRGLTPEQIDHIRQAMEDLRVNVANAFRMIGDTMGVDLVGDGSTAFHGVGGELKLADKALSDFSSASRQQLVLTTNTYRGKFTVPLSKLFGRGDQSMLTHLDESEAAETFDRNAESSAVRHIVTGNLLRGWDAAVNAASGSEGARPRVAIYTRQDGSVATGILMPPGWSTTDATSSSVGTVNDAQRFIQCVHDDLEMVAPGALVKISHGLLQVRANMEGRPIWSDPAFRSCFFQMPTQRGGYMEAQLSGDAFRLASLFALLQQKGVNLTFKPSSGESATMRSAGGGGGSPARGAFVSGVNTAPGKVPPAVQFGGMQFVKPLELPELVRLTRELTGLVPKVHKLPARGSINTFGTFGDGMITLDPLIFRDPVQAANVLGHEIGHLVDYLPHETLKRGNLLGHLLALRGWLKQNFGPLNNKALRDELLAVTKWWRPYDPVTDPKSYVKYRETPEELYADALSVMFNAPAELETRAPKCYEAFWKEIGRRPDVQNALFAIQELLNKGMLPTAQVREQDLRKGFSQGEALWKQAVADRKDAAASWSNWLTGPLSALYWRFHPLERRVAEVRARGVTVPPALDAEQMLDDLGFKDVDLMRFGRTINEHVIQPIEQAGMTLDDAGVYLFYNRVLHGDRSGLANPGGMTPAAARLGLLKLRLELGMGKMQRLADALGRFHEEIFKLAQQAVAVGGYNRDVFRTVIAPNKGNYATFAVLDYLDDYIPAGIKTQIGTLKAVANPFTASLLKAVGVVNLIAYQKAKNGTLGFLNTFFPGEVELVAKGEHPVAPKGKGLLMRLENGRPTTYVVDPYVASMFEQAKPHQIWKVVRAMNWAFNKFIHPVLISYNPAFGAVMFGKDAQRTSRNLPGWRMSTGLFPLEMLGNIGEAASRFIGEREYQTPSGRKYKGASSPLMRQMEALHALGTPFDTLVRANRDDFMSDLLRRMHVLPSEKAKLIYDNEVMKPVAWLLEHLELLNLIGHTVSKPAAFNRLVSSGMDRRQAAVWVRNNAGLANIQKKGQWVRYLRALRPFWNVWMQTIAADMKLATNPTTRGGWWFRYMSSNGMLRTLLALGAAGAFGAAIKEMFDGVSEYNKTKKLTLPVGVIPGGEFGHKVVSLTLPEDDTARFIGGIITHGINAAAQRNPQELHGIIDLGMNELPSYNPIWNVPWKWGVMAAGHNPVDDFTGRQIIPDRNFSAGGMNAVEPMLGWTLRQTGLLNIYRYDPHADTTWQSTVTAMPGVNRFLNVSDQGYREQQRAVQQDQDAARNMQFLQLPDKVQSLELEYWRLARTPTDTRSPEQESRLAELKYWYANIYRPAWTDIQDAFGNKQDAAAATARKALGDDSADFYRK